MSLDEPLSDELPPYINPALYEVPHEVTEKPAPAGRSSGSPLTPGWTTLLPHDEVGDDFGATDLEEEPLPEIPPKPDLTERALGAAAGGNEIWEPASEPDQEAMPPPEAPYKIRRTEKHTILVSARHPNPELVERTAAELSEGVPDTWPKYYDGTGSSPEYRVDDLIEPTIFVKIRGDTATLKQKIAQLQDPAISEKVIRLVANDTRKRMSVSHEIRLAPEVSNALKEEPVQEIAREAGFESLAFVEPLAAVIDVETGQKATAYPWQTGYSVAATDNELRSGHSTSPEWLNYMEKLNTLAAQLKEHLASKGIEATDLRPGNFIINTDQNGRQHLRIIDSERFTKMTPESPTYPTPESITGPTRLFLPNTSSEFGKFEGVA